MKDTELYQLLMHIRPPWKVERVLVDEGKKTVTLSVTHPEGIGWPCPECGKKCPLHDHTPERVWRHLDSVGYKTYIRARPPRVDCPAHGVVQVRLSWADTYGRFTSAFERQAIDVIQETDIQGASKILRLSWDEVQGIMERAVQRGLAAKPPLDLHQMGVDEKAVGHGQKYMTLVYNLKKRTVEWIGEDRKKETLDSFFQSLTQEQRTGIEDVGLDMWEPFILSILEHVPKATEKMVFDRFHIMKHANEGVDKVRRNENRELWKEGDPTLKGSKYLWLHRERTLPEKHRTRFEELQALNLKTGRAYALKEALAELWDYQSRAWAEKYRGRWHLWATHSRLKPMIEVARMIKEHLNGVMNYFTHRITNAVAEGLNSKVATIQKMAYGFRNKEHFKIAVLFRCGGLQLYPGMPAPPG